jgi:hypothetical protein
VEKNNLLVGKIHVLDLRALIRCASDWVGGTIQPMLKGFLSGMFVLFWLLRMEAAVRITVKASNVLVYTPKTTLTASAANSAKTTTPKPQTNKAASKPGAIKYAPALDQLEKHLLPTPAPTLSTLPPDSLTGRSIQCHSNIQLSSINRSTTQEVELIWQR